MTDLTYDDEIEFPPYDEPIIFDENGALKALNTADAIFDLLSEFALLRSKFGERITKQALSMMLGVMGTDTFKAFLFLSGRCVERVLDHYREYPSNLLNEVHTLLEGEFGHGGHGVDLLVNRAVESFSHSFQNGAAGKPNRLETLQTALESSYSQTPEAQTVNYARLGNIAEAAVGLGDKYQKVWAECLDTSMRDEVYLFSKKAGFPWSEADYDLPILNLILSVLPKDNLSFGQDSTFLRKVPLAIAVNYAQENAFSRRADVTILEANLDPQREAQALEATWALWAKAEPGELYCDAATALEAGAQL